MTHSPREADWTETPDNRLAEDSSTRSASGRALTRDAIMGRLAAAPSPRMRYAPGPVSPVSMLEPDDGEDNGLDEGEEGLSRIEAEELSGLRGDHLLNPGMLPLKTPRPAAVLIPLVLREEGTTVLLTRRTAHLKAHAGQISFPGGRIDPGDNGPAGAALRETWEEVGIESDHIALAGRLDSYVTRTGFEITPFIGFLEAPLTLVLNENEVAEAFEVPLAFVLDRSNLRQDTMDMNGMSRTFFAFQWKDYYIWGATAGMLVNLMEILG